MSTTLIPIRTLLQVFAVVARWSMGILAGVLGEDGCGGNARNARPETRRWILNAPVTASCLNIAVRRGHISRLHLSGVSLCDSYTWDGIL